MTTGWPCARLFFFFKIKSQAYENIGSRRRKTQSVLFYRFAGGIDFILFPLAPDQARLFRGIFHYPVANIPGQAGRLTDLHSDLPSSAARSRIKNKAISCTTPRLQRRGRGAGNPGLRYRTTMGRWRGRCSSLLHLSQTLLSPVPSC